LPVTGAVARYQPYNSPSPARSLAAGSPIACQAAKLGRGWRFVQAAVVAARRSAWLAKWRYRVARVTPARRATALAVVEVGPTSPCRSDAAVRILVRVASMAACRR